MIPNVIFPDQMTSWQIGLWQFLIPLMKEESKMLCFYVWVNKESWNKDSLEYILHIEFLNIWKHIQL